MEKKVKEKGFRKKCEWCEKEFASSSESQLDHNLLVHQSACPIMKVRHKEAVTKILARYK